METYRMVSPDYPQNTFVFLQQVANKAGNSFVIQLPLPNQMTYSTSFNWSPDEVPIVAQKVIDTYTHAHNSVGDTNDFLDYVAQISKKLPSELEKNADAYAEASHASLQKMFLNTAGFFMSKGHATGNYLLKAAGFAYNPNKQLFFNGVDHRQLSLSFDIIPQNKEQSSKCAAAIKKIRVASSPSYAMSNAYFTYPSYFDLKMVVNGVTVIEYNKFAITSVNTNLSPSGMMSWHADGKPVAYTLEINGIESEISTNDVEKKRAFLGV